MNAQSCGKWIYGNLPTYQQDGNGSVSFMSDSDFEKLTHMAHHGPYAKADGTLDLNINGSSSERLAGGVTAAHNHNLPITLSIVSWVNDYLPAIQDPVKRVVLIESILQLFDTYGYDGIELDLEPIMSPYVAGIQTGNPDYEAFVTAIYDSLQIRQSTLLGTAPLLVCSANAYAAPVLKNLEDKFDMVNLMTYDMSAPYPGWVSWHDSPVYDGGYIMPSTGNSMPSVNNDVQYCLANGISPSKLGIGISFDAFRWKGGSGTTTGGVTEPMQQYTSDPTWTRFSYSTFYNSYYNSAFYHYDNLAKMSYMSVDMPNDADDEFWSFNDEQSCNDKVSYAWLQNLGGVMIWELGSGYILSNPLDNRIPQLTAIANQNCSLYNSCTQQCFMINIIKN